MTSRTVARIWANWPLLAIIGTILGVGWGARAAISGDIETRVQASEARANQRIDREITVIGEDLRELKTDVRALRELLTVRGKPK